MIPDRSSTTVTSTISGTDVAMSIDQTALAHIMNILTDLYEDPELAIIREYATNALDSHVEAGQTRPIEIELPSDLRPLLTIRDFGVGLDLADIENIYSRYGASTKRNTNDAVGMLGLGCKSALAYVDQFSLVGVKDGERIMVSISRDEAGTGVMTVQESGSTDAPNGAEVIIPAKRYNDLEAKAAEFFRYWEPGTVLVDGKQPTPLDGWHIDDEFCIVDCEQYERKLRVVMGNVSYPVSLYYQERSKVLQSLPDKKQIVARVPIGMVQFTPSREGLQDHPATVAALDQVLATFRDACAYAIKHYVAGATDKPSAAKAYIEARNALGPKNVPAALYCGAAIPTVLSAEDLPPGSSLWSNRPVGGYRGSSSHRSPAGQVSLDDAGARPWIVGFDNQNWSATMRRKFNRYMTVHKLSDEPTKQTIYITDAPSVPMPEWIDGNVVSVDWADVRAWKDPEGGAEGMGSVSYTGKYDTYEPNGGYIREKRPCEILPREGRKLYYHVGTVDDRDDVVHAMQILSNDAYCVLVNRSRAAKFERQFPHARPVMHYAKKAAAGWWDSLSQDEKLACKVGIFVSPRVHKIMNALPPEKLRDPQLARWARILHLWKSGTLEEKFAGRRRYLVEQLAALDAKDIEKERCENVYNKYTLLQQVDLYPGVRFLVPHLILYVNAVYAAEKRK